MATLSRASIVFLLSASQTGHAVRKRVDAVEAADQAQENPLVDCGLRPALATSGESGLVDFTFTFGAPGTGSPALQNTRGNNRCFPGLRVWHTEGTANWAGMKRTDPVAFLANLLNFWHPWTEAEDVNVQPSVPATHYACGDRATRLPAISFRVSQELHAGSLYVSTARTKMCDLWSNLTILASSKSYMQNPGDAFLDSIHHGWRSVAWVLHDGNGATGGPQVTHLFQNPDTLDCTLTFQGTNSDDDWNANFDTDAVHFCGLVDQDESCTGSGTCSVKRDRSSFVHKGFRDRLRTIVRTPQWATHIKSRLPSCARLYVTGHSAGGAMAELFTACLAKAPKPEDYGYNEDYKYMEFVKGEPRLIPALGKEDK